MSLLAVAAWALALAVALGAPRAVRWWRCPCCWPLGRPRAARRVPPIYAVHPRDLARPAVRGRAHHGDRRRSPRGAGSPCMELLGPLAAGSVVASGRNRAVIALAAGRDRRRWSYELAVPRRGVHELGSVVRPDPRPLGPAHLGAPPRRPQAPCASIRASRPLRTLPRPVARPRVGRRLRLAGARRGDRARRHPASSRPATGCKQVNWRASLRLGDALRHPAPPRAQRRRRPDARHAGRGRRAARHHARPGRASRGLAGHRRISRGRTASASSTTAGSSTGCGPARAASQYERLADALARASVVFTYVAKDLAVVPPRVLPPQALVIAITSLLDPRFARAALDLAGARLRPRRARRLAGRR